MDSERPAASRIAGQTSFRSGILLKFIAMWRTFTFGKQALPNLGLGVLGRATDDESSRLRSYHRLADGDGR
ncbi:hypothetical protein SAMN04488124_1271 [Halogeometricum limi]|uniref:Uncharacterized protein n=1 Tax=Halogeometricum limi TaxID=555875 RepID=A0A1I6GMN1_9EURY|nr:hypothetical protein SAMN04488124_1271 [Halogeometricum limi]